MKPTITLYGIPNCDTVKKARAWFAQRGVAVRFHDFKQQGVPEASLQRWLSVLGHEALLNRRGTSWRALDEATRVAASDRDGAARALRLQPSLIKRPLVEWPGGGVSAGFDSERFDRLLLESAPLRCEAHHRLAR